MAAGMYEKQKMYSSPYPYIMYSPFWIPRLWCTLQDLQLQCIVLYGLCETLSGIEVVAAYFENSDRSLPCAPAVGARVMDARAGSGDRVVVVATEHMDVLVALLAFLVSERRR